MRLQGTYVAVAMVLACLLAGRSALAATILFDFEKGADVKVWHDEHRTTIGADKKLERVEQFATSGRFALRFFTPRWRPEDHNGRSKWPAFECQPPIRDWSAYDRLVFDITNTTDSTQRLMLFISDSKKPTRSGLMHRETLPPRSHIRTVIDLRKGFKEKGINPSDVHVIHIFTENPPTDMIVYLDNFVLLKPGEPLPTLPSSYVKQVVKLERPAVVASEKKLEETMKNMRQRAGANREILSWLDAKVRPLENQIDKVDESLARGDSEALDAPRAMVDLKKKAKRIQSLLDLRLAFEKTRRAVQVADAPRSDILAAFAPSTQKVLPRAGTPRLEVATQWTVRLARNEKESFQVIVVPFDRDAKGVSIRVDDLHSHNGAIFAAKNIEAPPVGYVQTKRKPPYDCDYVGWWPDPILDFMREADIVKEDFQAFWIRVRAPKDQPPATYHGSLQVLCEGQPVLKFGLTVRVYGFTLPDRSPLPLAITFHPEDHPTADTRAEQAKWRKSKDYPINAWKRHMNEWTDFLADYYITIDSLYEYGGEGRPRFDQLLRLKKQGRLGMFNLGYYSKCDGTPDAVKKWTDSVLKRLLERYARAKQLGLLSHAYIYGCDEHPKRFFGSVERAAEKIKAAIPDVMIMTTTYDDSFGLQSELKAIDAFCPLTPRYNLERADKARKKGKQVWWYICCGPHHPYPNMFVEYPAIDGRLLMGAMTIKYRPDGFLYYQISIWNSRKPIDHGPFTDWDPRSWTTYHGDGSWTCVGPDGTPLATIRLENFRDGLEDYAYARILEATIRKVEADPRLQKEKSAWLKRARAALLVPKDLVESMKSYSRDSKKLYRYRDGLAEAIEAASVEPGNPWK